MTMPTTLHHQVRIAAPPGAVWALISDVSTVDRYNPLVAKVRVTSPRRSGLGASRHCDFKPDGFADEEVTEVQEGKVLGMRVVRSSWPLARASWRTVLHPQPDGSTLVTQVSEYEMKFGLLGRLMDALMIRRRYAAVVDDVFAGLKREVERDAEREAGPARGAPGASPTPSPRPRAEA